MTEDESVAGFARKFRIEAAAALVGILRDPDASPNARTAAAERILAYSDGRPGTSKPITTDDLAALPDAARWNLLKSLLTFYPPTALADMIGAAVSAAMEQEEAKLATLAPPQPRFVRRAPIRAPIIPVTAQSVEPVIEPVQEVLPPEPPANVVPLPRGMHEVIHGKLDNPTSNGAVNGRYISADTVYRSGLAGDITFADYKRRNQ